MPASSLSFMDLLLFPLTWPLQLLRFTAEQLKAAVDQEWNDSERLEERLMQALVLYELGEMTTEDYKQVETEIVQRLAELREQGESW